MGVCTGLSSHSICIGDLSFKCKQTIPSGILKRDEMDRCLYMCVLLGTETYVRDKGWIYGPMFGAIVMQWTHANKFLCAHWVQRCGTRPVALELSCREDIVWDVTNPLQ